MSISVARFKHELKLGYASLLRVPGFAVTVIATLSITLGALICIFNLNHLLLFKSLPYPNADRLVVVKHNYTEGGKSWSSQSLVGMLHLYRKQADLAEFSMLYWSIQTVVNHPEQPKANVNYVTSEYFSMLKPAMHLGRAMTAEEGFESFKPVVVLSYDTWQKWYGGDKNIVGSKTQIGDVSYKVIGVTAKDFKEPQILGKKAIEMWLPWDYQPRSNMQWNQQTSALIGLGKMLPHMKLSQVNTSMSTLLNERYQIAETTKSGDFIGANIIPLKDVILGESRQTALLLLAGVVALLLIAIVNVTNLFLSRAAEKQRTLAIQAAMGAKKSQLFLSMFSESLLLCLVSGILGLMLSGLGFEVLRELASRQMPRLSELGIDLVTLSFTILIVLVLAAVFAKLSSRVIDYNQLQKQLQSSGKGSGLQISAQTRNILVMAQVMLATLLLVGTSAVIFQAVKMVVKPLGFEDEQVTYLEIDVPTGYDSDTELNILSMDIKSKLEAMSQVKEVARSMTPAIYDGSFTTGLVDENDQRVGSYIINRVDPNYFSLLELPIIAGRTFTTQTNLGEEAVREMILSESLARHLAPEGDAIGKLFNEGDSGHSKVVGIVQDYYNPGQKSDDEYRRYYLPFSPVYIGFDIKLNPGGTFDKQQAVSLLQSIDKKLRIYDFMSHSERHEKLIYKHKLAAGLTIVLSILSLILAGAGIYGVLNYSTQMRRYELGIHMALGAKAHRVQKMVLKESLKPVLIGLCTSLVLVVILFLVLRQQLTTMINLDVLSISGTVALMLIVSYFACFLPVRKIINADPIKALRNE